MVTYEDYATNNVYRFLTNNMEYEALTIHSDKDYLLKQGLKLVADVDV